MEPTHWIGGPTVDYGVERRLRRLDPQLRLTWSPYALNPDTGRPIEMSGKLDPYTGQVLLGPVSDPCFYLWRKDTMSSHHYFISTYPRFGHWEVLNLEADLARFHSAARAARMMFEAAERNREREAKHLRGEMSAKVMDNKRLALDVMQGKATIRDPKTFSAPGLSRKSSAEGSPVPMENRELGIED